MVVVGALVLLVALGLGLMLWDDRAGPAPAPEAQQASPATPVEETAEQAPIAATGPSFDVVRIDSSGNTVIAGRAEPDSTVIILDDGEEIGRVTTDRRGEWVFLPDSPLPPGSRELSLRAIAPDGAESVGEETVVLVVPEMPEGRTLALRAAPDGSAQLLQGATPLGEQGALAVDVIDYDDDGRLTISGRAVGDATVQVYLNNDFLGRATARREDGAWTLRPDVRVPYGDHVLRADMLGPDGAVAARVEVPFTRLEPDLPEGVRVVVQPGNNLWHLARRLYGDGRAFTVIYDANQGHIRDPDLIYPGQVFIVPAGR